MKPITIAFILWTFGFSGIAQNISVTFTGNGAATTIDTVIATNLMTGQSVTLPGNETLILAVYSGIPSLSGLTVMGMVYPNPFSGKATFITMAEKPQTVHLKVQNLMGQVVTEHQAFVKTGENEFTFSVNAAGIYIVSLTTGQGTACYKVICTGATESESRIQYLGTASGDDINPSKPSVKSYLTGYTLGYTPGDVILYKCISGNSVTIISDSPTSSMNYDVVFIACTDPDGRNYSIVTIGNQTWMAENLAYLPAVSPSTDQSDTDPYYYVYGYEGRSVSAAKASANFGTYGVLYNWAATLAACPSGWHLPTDGEWKILEMNLGMSSEDADLEGWRTSGTVGGKLKGAGTTLWVSPNLGATNASGFNALPSGIRYIPSGFSGLGYYTDLWTSSERDASAAMNRGLFYDLESIYRAGDQKRFGLPVRCLYGAVPPIVSTAHSSATTETSATSGGNISSDGGAVVTGRGVCWSVSPNPTIADSNTTDGSGAGSFSSTLGSLNANSTYYVRAYATNSAGTAYGQQEQFLTPEGTFAYEGRTYGYRTIGTQTWMTENLAYLPAVSRSSIGSRTLPNYYVYGYEGINVSDAMTNGNYSTYGVLYNRPAALTACPAGWHLPTDEEWTTLTTYLGGDSTAGGKMKEMGTTLWVDLNTGASNESGFSARPGGYRNSSGGFLALGSYTYYWTPLEYDTYRGWGRGLQNNLWELIRNYYNRANGFSIRCLRN